MIPRYGISRDIDVSIEPLEQRENGQYVRIDELKKVLLPLIEKQYYEDDYLIALHELENLFKEESK